MVEYLDNPAGRLKQWVDRFQTVSNRDTAVSDVLGSMLGVEVAEVAGKVEVTRFAMQLAALGDDIRAKAALLPESVDADVLLEDFEQFDRVFDHLTMARQVRVGDMMAQVDAAAVRSLDLLSRQFHRHCPEPVMNEASREKLLEDVQSLREQVEQEEGLADDLREFILVRFGEVERVLRDVPVAGSVAVEVVTDSLIGSIQRQPQMWQRITESTVSGIVSGIVVALFSALVTPPPPDALPPATPQPVVTNYVQVYSELPDGRGGDDTGKDSEGVGTASDGSLTPPD
ncbi:hypothetical protein ACNKF0_09345 [Nocardioides sp. T5]|uniref:hypothetical protein n=1 Tax=Nocardioides sp. T5 TaxID=3400182 RepID=UPI003A83A645